MSKVTITHVSNIGGNPTSAATTLNTDMDTLAAAFDNTLSLDGTAPNQMGADFDMNGHKILNLPTPAAATDVVRLEDLQAAQLASTFTVGVGAIYGGTTTRVLYDNNGILGEYSITGTGAVVMSSGPTVTNATLVTPILGVATATTINKVTITQPLTGATLTLLDGKTLTIDNTLTFAGTDGTTITFQGTDTYVGRNTTDTLTNKTLTTPVVTSPTINGTATGTAIGTTANKLVQLDGAAKLPAVDGSQLTNLPSLSDFYMPETYGAVGNGVTDDRAAIQNCLNAAATAGKPVLFSQKTYAINATTTGIVLDATTGSPPVILFNGTTWKQTAGTNKTFTISNIQNATAYKGLETIGRLTIDSNSLATNGLYIHGLQATSNGVLPIISGISVKGSTSIGINVIGEPSFGVYGVHFAHLSATNCGAQGFQFSSINNTGNYYVQACHVSDIFATGCTGGMYVDYGGATFTNVWFETNTGPGVTLGHTQDIVFLGGHCEANIVGGTTDTPFQGTASQSTGVKVFGTRCTGALTNLYGGTNNSILPCAIGYTVAGSSDAAGFDIIRPNQIAFGSATSPGGNCINVPSTVANYIEFLVDNNGAAQFRGDGALFSGITSMWLTYHNGSIQRLVNVSLGAADSGGTGYKLLRVPN